MKNKFGEQDCYGKDFGLSWNGKGICRVCEDKVSCRAIFEEVCIPSKDSQWRIDFQELNKYDEAKANK